MTESCDRRIAEIVSAWSGRDVVRVKQGANLYASRHRSGIAICDFATAESISVFWKSGAAASDEGAGRLGSVGNEIDAYRALHHIGDAPAPILIGGDSEQSDALLVSEYLASAHRVQKSPRRGALAEAAARIGAFHERSGDLGAASLDRYDAGTFTHWAERSRLALPDVSWLGSVATSFPARAAALQETSESMIHGEFYPDNVLIAGNQIAAVDWEWAGVGMGEIDLAALTEGWWDEPTVSDCAESYASRRGIDPCDRLFQERLAAARLYLHFRWLGGHSRRSHDEEVFERLELVQALAGTLGLLPARGGAR
jgi:aminoglycoside phosphotransferase (APT) family kinase protein